MHEDNYRGSSMRIERNKKVENEDPRVSTYKYYCQLYMASVGDKVLQLNIA